MRYKRLCFGVKSAAEQFQHAIQQAIDGIPGVRNIAHDIIWGHTKAEHDHSFQALLERLVNKNVTLNQEKCSFDK